jgi:uncharacterized protein
MKVILDTNVLLVSLPTNSRYHKIFNALYNGQYSICISNDILLEYEEQLAKWFGVDKTNLHLADLINLQNIELISPTFHWHLIDADVDDNKFCDCALAANANFIVTNDKHFNILKQLEFPKINILTADEFLIML